ncbi:hypothetical protein [Pseudomonas aeruginosa]|uniref:hypothetical protein n=1 Tax=Pseudomonas aeruginosa TaxID=287 RepID=UPI000E2C55F8|nr:hypothetical protein [Pseudomonas aeruginosa]MDC3991889.1 hypothetical protein [Pseudomonas aeruginosa]RQE90756.1 hypothetical protein IPC292_03160 [Pseudomonas aeruginosa]WCV06891.1 hypothetical protein KKY73_29910 [Pseudomonas aeruginosa]SVK36106.1 Uncharacterised protein [Acinetobacter baumannii]
MKKVLLLSNGLDTDELAIALNARRIELCQIEPNLRVGAVVDEAIAADLFANHSGFVGLIFAPAFPMDSDGQTSLDEMSDLLVTNFTYLKAALTSFEERNIPGRLISLLPGDAAMGDPAQFVNSTLAGAMLSLFRTVALELRKKPITANTLMYSTASEAASSSAVLADPAAIAALIEALLASSTGCVNGQEIYAQGAADVGRLHP